MPHILSAGKWTKTSSFLDIPFFPTDWTEQSITVSLILILYLVFVPEKTIEVTIPEK